MTRTCIKYKIYYSIRKNSFFENIKLTLKQILSILLKYSCKIQRFQIILSMENSPKTIARILSRLVSIMPATDFSSNKLGGPGLIVQIDETMLNYKCKSHRGRSSTNKMDSLCIVEVGDKIIRTFATAIPDKKESTLLPIICSQVANNSVIWTDEHRSYSNLRNYNFTHGTVCHKFEFVDNLNGINTQTIESFNNWLKLKIKRRKSILNNNREIFLKEFLFLLNEKAIY